MKNIFFFITNFFLIASCVQTKSRDPINSNKKSFLNKSVDSKKDIKRKEKIIFKKIIERDSKSKYIVSDKGYYFKILNSSKKKIKTQIR